jgi:nucleoside-diphosphate-sugar epimerase
MEIFMPSFKIDTSKPVLVTGATGYVAGWIVKKLLEAGVTVHATVRDPENAAKVGHLTQMGQELPGAIKLFKADLLESGSFDAAMKGCGIVFHTASPYLLNVEDPQRDLIDPALKGTHNVLDSVNRTESVSRVVLTSSCAAIYGDVADVAAARGGILTEEVWNTSSNIDHVPYSYSKTLAEKAAWEVAKAQSRWRLVVINPAGVYGPYVGGPIPTSASFDLLRQLGSGAVKSGVPHLQTGKVDVRDVADAHIAAAYIADAEGRHIVSEKSGTLLDMANAVRVAFPNYPLPSREMPGWLIWLVGPMVNKAFTRNFISRNIGKAWRADNSKSQEKLGITYHSSDKAIVEMFGQMAEAGAFGKKAR